MTVGNFLPLCIKYDLSSSKLSALPLIIKMTALRQEVMFKGS
jgi:hypothetical protein